jgi:hypothetical protein
MVWLALELEISSEDVYFSTKFAMTFVLRKFAIHLLKRHMFWIHGSIIPIPP